MGVCLVADRLKPISVDSFRDHVNKMHEERDKGFEAEYQVRLLSPSLSLSHVDNGVCVCGSLWCLSRWPHTRWPRDNTTESRIALQTSSPVRAPHTTSSVGVIVPPSLSLSLSHQMMSLVSNWERFLERKALITSMPAGWTWVSNSFSSSGQLTPLSLSPSLRATTGPESTLLLKVKWSLPPPLLY